MKNLLALFCGLIFFASCTSKDLPDNLINRKEIANVLIDMHLADASLDYAYNPDSMLIFAKSKYNYIFEKYSIDSAAFSQSLNYYSKDSERFAEIYKSVLDSLERINKPEVAKIYRTKRTIPDSLRFKKKSLSEKDSLLVRNNKADSLKAQQPDSLRNLSKKTALLKKEKTVKDSVKTTTVKVKPLDIYLKKTDSLNTVKLLAIGIDF